MDQFVKKTTNVTEAQAPSYIGRRLKIKGSFWNGMTAEEKEKWFDIEVKEFDKAHKVSFFMWLSFLYFSGREGIAACVVHCYVIGPYKDSLDA